MGRVWPLTPLRIIDSWHSRFAILHEYFPFSASRIAVSSALSFAGAVAETSGFAFTIYLIRLLTGDTAADFSRNLPRFLQLFQINNDHLQLPMVAAITLGLFSAKTICCFLAEKTLTFEQQRLLADCRIRLFANYLRLSKKFHDTVAPGKLQNCLVYGTSSLMSLLPLFRRILLQAATLIGYLVVMFSISFHLTVACIALLPVVFALTHAITRKLSGDLKDQTQKNNASVSRVTEILSYLPLARLYLTHRQELARFQALAHDLQDIQLRISHANSRSTSVIEFSSLLLLVALALLHRHLTNLHVLVPHAGTLVYFVILNRTAHLMNEITRLGKSVASALPHAQDLRPLLEQREMDLEPIGDICFPKAASHLQLEIKHIEFRNLSFSHKANATVIDRASFSLVAGENIALLGPSGVGKSTIVGLLLRLYQPTAGTILVNDIPLPTIALADWRRAVIAVTQEMYFLNDSVRVNITYGLEYAPSEQEIWGALQIADLSNWVTEQRGGLEMIVGNGGQRLSVGQRQRLAIARAVIRRPQVLILDEATSNIDFETEAKILTAIFDELPTTTVLVITHRDISKLPIHKILRFTNQGSISNSTLVVQDVVH